MGHRGEFARGFKNGHDVEIAVFAATTLQGAVTGRYAISGNVRNDHHRRTAQTGFNDAKETG